MIETTDEGFHSNGVPFIPIIQDVTPLIFDWSNTATIRLNCQPNHDLNWTEEETLAKKQIAAGKYIFWELDLGLADFICVPEDSASFFAFSLAIEEFSKSIFPKYQKETFAVCLYRGTWEPKRQFPQERWPEANPEKALAEYLHRLCSFLPESLPLFLLLDVSNQPYAASVTELLLDLDQFQIGLKGAKSPFKGICWEEGYPGQGWLALSGEEIQIQPLPTVGLCVPANLDGDLYEKIDQLAASMPLRLIAEEKLFEQWGGLERLLVFSDHVSASGRRQLLGFQAAGGLITSIRDQTTRPLQT